MKSLHVLFAALCALTLGTAFHLFRPHAPRALAAPQQPAAPFELSQYYLVLLHKGPAWTPGSSPELEELQKRHIAHIQSLGKVGKALLAGPVEDHGDGTLRGIIILQADTLEQARELESADPAVRAGRLKIEAHTLWVRKDTFCAAQPQQ